MVTVSAVIPATDGRPTLDRVVRAVKGARAAPEEVIVVDRPPRLGPAAARNLGARSASGDVIVFVDADVEVHQDVFERIRATFDADPGLTAVFGSYDDDPGGEGIVSDFRNLLHHYVHHRGAGRATTFWAGLGAVRQDSFLRVGGFDEARFPKASIEDIELGMRLSQDGGRILLDPSIQGKHLKSWTVQEMIETDLQRRAVPWLRVMLAEGYNDTALNLGWRHRLSTGATVVLVAALVRRNFRLAAAMLGLILALDGDFYALLNRRRGAKVLAAGIPLHIVHRLTSAISIPLALGGHLLTTRSRRV